MPPRVEADPTLIRSHGDDVAAAGDALRAAAGTFETAAFEVNDAFGFLGPSAETMQEYLDMASETIGGLQRLATQLQNDGAALRLAADNYDEADASSTVEV